MSILTEMSECIKKKKAQGETSSEASISCLGDLIYKRIEKPANVLKYVLGLAGVLMLIYGIMKKSGLLIFFGILYIIPFFVPQELVFKTVFKKAMNLENN